MSEPFDTDLYAHASDDLRKQRRENGWCEHDNPPEHCRRCHPELDPLPSWLPPSD